MPNETDGAPARALLTEPDIHVALAALGMLPYLAWARPDLMPRELEGPIVEPDQLHALPGMAVVA